MSEQGQQESGRNLPPWVWSLIVGLGIGGAGGGGISTLATTGVTAEAQTANTDRIVSEVSATRAELSEFRGETRARLDGLDSKVAGVIPRLSAMEMRLSEHERLPYHPAVEAALRDLGRRINRIEDQRE